MAEEAVHQRVCVECEDAPASLSCDQCKDELCGLCFNWLHQRGTRAQHTTTAFMEEAVDYLNSMQQTQLAGTTREFALSARDASRATVKANLMTHEGSVKSDVDASFKHRVATIPLRLTDEERELLRLLEGALDVSEYTDKVDVASNDFGWGGVSTYKKVPKMRQYLDQVFELIVGLHLSVNFKTGQRALKKDLVEHQDLLRSIFEIGRRHKVLNPEKMRSTFGKMMCILQDVADPRAVGIDCYTPIKTVRSLLEERGKLSLLDDGFVLQVAVAGSVDMRLLTSEEAKKEREQRALAVEQLVKKHVDEAFTRADLMRVIHSCGDANAYITANRHPVDKMINYLKYYFEPEDTTDEHSSLQIRAGRETSKLSHSHRSQYTFVTQTLHLWREIQNCMFELWMCADADLQDSQNSYRLYNTGQGMQRVQRAPRVSAAMSRILGTVKKRMRGNWVGLSVVHLGDRDVPNALVFIDKYTQVPRILAPIVLTVERIGVMASEDPNVQLHLEQEYGGVDALRRLILRDYFRHGFNGSGDDGGSCIDGRLTSSWNWCSLLSKKVYHHIFCLSGFEGFDGSFL